MKVLISFSRDENIKYFGTSQVELDLEEYLKGVVPSEIGNAHIEACAAQAVAARNFAMSRFKKDKGHIQISDQSSKDQAYRASRLTGYPNAYAGVEKTTGQLLYYGNNIAKCYYSSSNGGQTTSSKARWGGDYAYLISQPDPFDNGNGSGHGVGMSQNGAKNRAAAGQTYEEILAFYFPGTYLKNKQEVIKMTKVEYLLEWMQNRIGNPYIYGANQKDCTVSYRKERIVQYPQYEEKITDNCQVLNGSASNCKGCKWYDNEQLKAKSAYDCAQFVRYGAKAVGINDVVSGATSQWKSDIWAEKGEFKNIPQDKLCCVFRDLLGTKQHVGWYYNGFAYHAQGHNSGVVKTDNKQYKSWTHYAIMKDLYDSNGNPIEMDESLIKEEEIIDNKDVIKVLYSAKVTASSGSTVNMRADSSTSGYIIKRVPIGALVDVVEETGDWCQIVYDNKTGYMMSKFLAKQEGGEAVTETYYVKIQCASAQEAKRLAELLGQATVG